MASIRHKLRQALIELLAPRARSGSIISRVILGFMNRSVIDIGVIEDGAEVEYCLARESVCRRILPNFGDSMVPEEIITHPRLNGYLLRNAVVSTNSSQIQSKNTLLMPRQRFDERHRITPNCNQIGTYTQDYAVCKKRCDEYIDKAIFLGGDGAFNWYHYILECASKAYLLRYLPDEFQQYPVILPAQALKIESYNTVARILLPNRTFLCPPKGVAKVGELIVLDEVSQGPFSLFEGEWPKMTDYWQHEDMLLAMFSELRAALLQSRQPFNQSRRIFIMRPETRRIYNQEALLEIARKFGFEPVSPETLSLTRQAQLYAEASHVIGASGAAWTNMIFAPKPFKALTWIPAQYEQFCSYSMLANLMGHDLRYLACSPDWEIKSVAEAHAAPYQVSVTGFEAAVATMCEEC